MSCQVDFLYADKHQRLYKLLLQKKVKDKNDFLHGDKYQRFLQTDAAIFVVCDQACPKYPK